MITLKRLALSNIRSYTDLILDIPKGATLLEGDIGSGKSTVLMAVEFALFGFGDIKQTSMLRIGEERGEVELQIEVDGKEYTLHREIHRDKKGGITQKNCYIETANGRLELSPSEMKAKVLDILKFREPKASRASSVVYRYSIYTPQEEMKEILYSNPEERLETVRKIFNLEKYQTARENASKVVKALRNMRDISSMAVENKEEVEAELKRLKDSIPLYEQEKKRLESEREKLAERRKKLAAEKDTVQQEIEKLREDAGRLEQLKRNLASVNKTIGAIYDTIQKKNKYITDQESARNWIRLADVRESRDDVERRRKNLLEELTSLSAREGAAMSTAKNYERLVKEGVCPMCGREAHPEEYMPKLQGITAELQEIREKIAKNRKEIERLDKLLRDIDENEKKKRELENIQKNIDNALSELAGLREQAGSMLNEKSRIEKEIKSLEQTGEETEKALERRNKIQKEIDRIDSEDKEIASNAGKLEESIRNAEESISSLKGELKEIEEEEKKIKVYSALISFIEDVLIPATSDIEQSVMAEINREMEERVSELFSRLVTDPAKELTIDQEFSPLMRQNGYDLDVESLSGGERSAVALSYRLALNTLVNRYAGNAGVLILDEPTDGFSKEQLQRFGDLLRDLESEQVIIVSHEAELENVADNVIRVEKAGGASRAYLI